MARSLSHKQQRLKQELDKIRTKFGRHNISPDPVEVVHEYTDRADREVVGLIAAVLAYGSVFQILKSIRRIVKPLGRHPAEMIAGLSDADAIELCRGFQYRFNTEVDAARLLRATGDIFRKYGSLEACFQEHDQPESSHIGPGLLGLVSAFKERAYPALEKHARRHQLRTRYDYFFPSPDSGSACKRLNLFLRWMVRPEDGVDFGLWKVDPGRLVIPLDTHVSRIARQIGLSRRRQADWKMACEITDGLRKFCPEDPLRYDFALAHLGIRGECAKCADAPEESDCGLGEFCVGPIIRRGNQAEAP